MGLFGIKTKRDGTVLDTGIIRIDIFTKARRNLDVAYANEQAGIGLRYLTKDQVEPGDILRIKNAGLYEMSGRRSYDEPWKL